jgi:hypothetical protein
MTKPAPIRQADIRRAIKAARAEGWRSVSITMPDGVVLTLNDAAPLASSGQKTVQDQTSDLSNFEV